MDSQALLLAAAAGAAALAVGAALWALLARRASEAGDRETAGRLSQAEHGLRAAEAAAEAFETAVLALTDGSARLVAGEESLAVCAERLGAASGAAADVLA